MRTGIQAEIGLIPAHTGKTLGSSTGATPRWAHSRTHGENTEPVNGHWIVTGSFPHTRGKRAFASFERA